MQDGDGGGGEGDSGGGKGDGGGSEGEGGGGGGGQAVWQTYLSLVVQGASFHLPQL